MRFLIVDDDAKCRFLLGDILSQYGECSFAANGTEALEAVRQSFTDNTPFDAILLDIMMPDINGHETLATIRNIELERGIDSANRSVVIMVTAVGDMQSVISSINEGCHSYINKPVDEEQLISELSDAFGTRLTKNEPSSENGNDFLCEDEKNRSDYRYLIVDDDFYCRELMKDILKSYGECVFAENGTQAVERIRQSLEEKTPFDAILLDITMPDMDGHEALKQIREVEVEHGIFCLTGCKVVMTTALSDAPHIMTAFRNGCEAYVVKPIDEEQLLVQLRELEVAGFSGTAVAQG